MAAEKGYFRIILGKGNKYVEECRQGGFIGGDWGFDNDLSDILSRSESVQPFKEYCLPIFQKNRPGKSKIASSLACGMLYTICKRIQKGDIVLCPNGSGSYLVGEVVGDYYFYHGEFLPHRRSVQWYPNVIERNAMSETLQRSVGSIGTVSEVTKYRSEIDGLLSGNVPAKLISTDELVEDPTVFALEKHLEDFLVKNWGNTELGQNYDIFEEEGEMAGQQYPCDTGMIDILATSKDKRELLVVELKKGRASDAVVGQIQRYMGYVKDELAESNQTVRGVIIALEDDLRIRRALSVTNNIDFYRYQVNFKLFKG